MATTPSAGRSPALHHALHHVCVTFLNYADTREPAETPAFGPFEFLQLTYTLLRGSFIDGPEDVTAATFNDEHEWVVELDGPYRGKRFSDLVVNTIPPGSTLAAHEDAVAGAGGAAGSPMGRYRIEVHHGEHRSLWYIIDTGAPDDEQPAVVRTCFSLGQAEHVAGKLNAAAQRDHERREARFVEQQRQFDDLDEIRGGGYR